MKNLDSQSEKEHQTIGTTVYPSGQRVHGPIKIFEPNSDGLSGSLARDGNVADKQFNIHYTDDVQELADLHDANGRPISVFPTSIFRGIQLENNNSLMALELSERIPITREELNQTLGKNIAICFHGDHTKVSEIQNASAVLPQELAEISRGKTMIALTPNISVKNKFIGLESKGKPKAQSKRIPGPIVDMPSGPTTIFNGY